MDSPRRRPRAQAYQVFEGRQQDKDADIVRERIDDGTYTWAVWFEGNRMGPLSVGRGIDALPTVLVLDREGALRSIDPSAEELMAVVGEWVDV